MSRQVLLLCALCAVLAGALPLPQTRVGVIAAPGTTPGTAPGAPPEGGQRFLIVPGESSVTYRVNETFISEGNRLNTAVGVTTVVRGEIVVDRARPSGSRVGPVTVDISQFKSDSARRDGAIRDRWLESGRFPIAEFAATSIQGLPEVYQESRELSLQISGNLRIRNVARPVTFASTAKLDGSILTVTGTTTIKMTDFGFNPPSILGILRSDNEAKLEFKFIARP